MGSDNNEDCSAFNNIDPQTDRLSKRGSNRTRRVRLDSKCCCDYFNILSGMKSDILLIRFALELAPPRWVDEQTV